MSGKPAARQGDETLDGGPIVQGSQMVLIGSQGGIACSVCPGGVKKGSPVNPQLGAKVLLGAEDLDFALPGALPVVWQRQYSSYVNAEHGAACGLLGHGWHLLTEIALELKARALLLFDSAGRVITFEESLPPGGQQYSASEDLWLLRGGKDPQGYPAFWSRQPRFTHVGAELAANEQCIIATNGAAETLWVFTPDPERESRWRLSAQTDRFGRSQSYQYSTSEKQRKPRKGEDPLPAGRLVAITDGAGRRYRLQQQRIHPGEQAQGPWAADTGWRLIAVQLEHDPHHATPEPITLVRYGYDRAGQLITVHDRAGQLVREFEWSRHRISAHRHQAGPWHRYQYAGQEPELKVIAQTNEQGLDYKFQYISQQPSAEGKPRSLAIVTDSIGRVETYRFEGAAGLSRLIEHQRADGGVMRNRFDGYGRQVAKTDPLGRTTWIRRDAQGNITGLQEPGGIRSSHSYDESGRITESQDADGAVTKYQYDPYLRLSRITLADQSTHHYRYPDPKEHPHACDSPSEIQDAKGGLKRLAYNSAGQLASYTDCSGQSTRYRHDRWGEVIEIRDALGQYTVHERDAQGRIAATRLPNGQTSRYQYNARGQLTRIQPDENTPGSVLEMQHDLWGRLIQSTQGGLTLQFKYDKAGRLSTLINENQAQSRFAWDVMDRLTQEEGFDERLQRYEWDVAGQLKASHDGNAVQMQAGQAQSSHYQWDEAGRLQEIRTSATQNQLGQVRRYKWGRAGRMKPADVYQIEGEQEHLQTRVEFERDTLERLTREIQRIYKQASAPGAQPKVEYEHQITHQFDELGISYFGWDGDRLVRTERLKEDGTRQIEYIVHEPGTFTPLVRLSTTAQGGSQVKPNFLVQATQAAMPADKRNSADTLAALEMMQGML
jgi:YD repeat-containing protein